MVIVFSIFVHFCNLNSMNKANFGQRCMKS
jgi:hypothetical protein